MVRPRLGARYVSRRRLRRYEPDRVHSAFWTLREDNRILMKAEPDVELAKNLGRSVNAIRSRRWLLRRRQREVSSQ